jgi:hypothetical protein
METMQLITSHPYVDATTLDDPAIEALFARAGLPVEVVDHCHDVSCPDCFGRRRAKAA